MEDERVVLSLNVQPDGSIIASVNKIRCLSSGTFMEFANADIMVL